MSFWKELQRRNVFRVGAAYVVFAWLVVQITETILPIFDVPDVFLRGVILVLVLGFPLAIFFAWAFELTPEGLKREADVNRERSIAPLTGHKLDHVIIAILLVAVGYFVVDEFVFEPRLETAGDVATRDSDDSSMQAGEDKSIAVLPFSSMSENSDNEYFADGVAEELLNLLTRVGELRVISRASSFSFEGQSLDIGEIAERLSVAHILDGSVRKVGNRVRVAVQLIDARSDTQLWSQSYDRTLDDIFAIQDEIAASVVDQLKVTLLGDVPTAEQARPEAYQLYLQAKHVGYGQSEQAFEESNALYRRALEIDPDYADAWAGLGLNMINQIAGMLVDVDEGAPMAREALENALAIEPDHALAYSRLGSFALFDTDLPEAVRQTERALELAPGNADVLHNAAYVFVALGQLDRGIALTRRVIDRDPVNAVSHGNMGLTYYYAGQWEDARDSFETALRLSPEFRTMNFAAGATLLHAGDLEGAEAAFEREPLDYLREHGLVLIEFQRGHTAEFETRRAQWMNEWSDEYPLKAAQLLAYSGQVDAAFTWLDRAIEQNSYELGIQFLEPYYDPIRNDPRWKAFLRRVGTAPEQLEALGSDFTLPADLST